MRRLDILTFLLALALWVPPLLPARASSLPDEAHIPGVVGHPQTLPLSCESRSAADWAAFWGVEIEELEFQDKLPRSDNPNKGFVGDPRDEWGWTPPYSYGVHAAPVAELLRAYGLDARAETDLSWEDLQTEIAAGRPVIVWVVGNLWAGNPRQYTSKDGEVVTVAGHEHTMILVGYDARRVHLIDAFTGHNVSYRIAEFLESWESLGRMAVLGEGTGANDDALPANTEDTAIHYTVQPGDTLSNLAARWSLTWEQIASANQLAYPYALAPGQELIIGFGAQVEEAAQASPAAHHIVQPGEYLRQIADDLDLDWEQLAEINDLAYPYSLFPGDVLQLPVQKQFPATGSEPTPATYTASGNESLFALAYRFDLSWAELAARNGLRYPYMLAPGQTIHLK